MVSCVACGISQANKKTKELKITFHRFPGNAEKRKAWIQIVPRTNWEPSKTSVLCSQHFPKECFSETCNITRLKESAIPTIKINRLKWVKTTHSEEHSILLNKTENSKPLLPCPSSTFNTATNSSVQQVLHVFDSPCKVKTTHSKERSILLNQTEKSKPLLPCPSSTFNTATHSSVQHVLHVFDSPCKVKTTHSEQRSILLNKTENSKPLLPCPSSTSNIATSTSVQQVSHVLDTPSKIILNRTVNDLEHANVVKSKKIRLLQKTNWQQKKTIASLKGVIQQLKFRNLILKQRRDCLPSSFVTLTNRQHSCNNTNVINNENIDHDYALPSYLTLPEYEKEVTIYIASFVSHTLVKHSKCETCIEALVSKKEQSPNKLVFLNGKGGRIYPNDKVITICRCTEKLIRGEPDEKINKQKIINLVLQNYIENPLFEYMICASEHSYLLAKSIISHYVNTRIHYVCRKMSESDQIRNICTKLVFTAN